MLSVRPGVADLGARWDPGLGGAQVACTTIVLAFIVAAFDFSWQAAATIGFSFALSSTALVMASLAERGLDGVMVSVSGQLDLNYVPFEELVDPNTLVTVVRYVERNSDFHRLARFLETFVNE